MRSTITFNGKSSADFGLIVEYYPESVHAPRRGELITIPGRNGVIIREDGAYDTYSQTYQIWFRNTMNRDTFQIARDVAEWLLGASGFCRLEDTYEPEYFRLARFNGPLNVETVLKNHGRATLEFDVQPQRFFKSGETPITFTGGEESAIVNPTLFESRPLLKFVDTSVAPAYEPVTLTMRQGYVIDANGAVVGHEGLAPASGKVSLPVNVQGKENVKITGNGYVFLDSNGKTRPGGFVQSGKIDVVDGVVHLPSSGWVVSMRVSCGMDDTAAVALQDPRPNPGVAAVTINGITIDLDFSGHDTIYLDCDLHDAYYPDGGNANKKVSFSSTITDYPTFPGLRPGSNSIIPGDGSILDFELTPRWWTL